MTRYAILTLLALGLACGTDEAAPDPGPGRIIFSRAGNQRFDPYAMDLNGTNLQKLTTSFAIEDWAAWSPER